jgi:hypothetical protein
MLNVVAVQEEIAYRHQQLVDEANEYRRVRSARAPRERRSLRLPFPLPRARRSSARPA